MTVAQPIVRWRAQRAAHPVALVLALHGRGADESSLDALTDQLPDRLAVVALRGPIPVGPGFAWFENRGIGRPLEASLADSIAWVRAWLDATWPGPVYLLGFSGGTAMAGALLLADPARFAGAVLLSGTLPFDAGLPTIDGRLAGIPVFHGHGELDSVIPSDLVDRTTGYLAGPAGSETVQHLYPGLGHSIDRQVLRDVVQWFSSQALSLGDSAE